jgi:hypothetical protein
MRPGVTTGVAATSAAASAACHAKRARVPAVRVGGAHRRRPTSPRSEATRRRDVASRVVADDAPASVEVALDPNAPAALTSKALGVERGQTLPPVPGGRVHWVADAAGVAAMREAVMDPAHNPTTREGHPPVVGLDGEWKPGSRTPVSILQVATRTDAFVVDLFAVAKRDAPDDAREAFDAFLHELLFSDEVYKLGFSFGYDLTRMKASYPHLASLRQRSEPKAMVDVKQLAHAASANRSNLRVGLATLTKMVLGATLSKEQQCSDWSRRPLSAAQVAYAAADAFYLNLIFDKCVEKSHGKLLLSLDDVVKLGDPRAKGKHLPRKAKKALKKQAALAARLTKQGANGGGFGAAGGGSGRRPDVQEVNVDLSSIIAGSRVGQATAGGRKGVARLLSADKDVRAAKRGGAVERWANAAVLYLSVGAPGKKTGAGEFWEEGEGGDLFMRPDEAALEGAEAAIKRTPLEACLSTKRGEGGCGEEDPEAEEACDVGDDDETSAPAALLFMRRPPGNYVFCGRLESAPGTKGAVRLVDAAALREGSTFHQLVGCRLREAPPRA